MHQPSIARKGLPALEAERYEAVLIQRQINIPTGLASAVKSASSLHTNGLIAFAHPINAADRREYQVPLAACTPCACACMRLILHPYPIRRLQPD